MGTELTKVEPTPIQDYEWTEEQVVSQVAKIQRVMKAVMKEGTHFGVIPGCKLPSLLKPGAEKLSMTFRLIPRFSATERNSSGGHREVEVFCDLTHGPTGQFMGQGVGSCSTMETKYRYREARRKCPKCDAEAIIKGKEEYGGGWLCFGKQGGCGAKFKDKDPLITEQRIGRVENPDIADCYNTVLKMAKKRAHVDAVLTATGASDIFTQDMEDLPLTGKKEKPKGRSPAKKKDADTEEKIPSHGKGASEHDGGGSRMASEGQTGKLYAMLKSKDATKEEMASFKRLHAGKESAKDWTMTEIQAAFELLDTFHDHQALEDWIAYKADGGQF